MSLRTVKVCSEITGMLNGEWVSQVDIENLIEVNSALSCPKCGGSKLFRDKLSRIKRSNRVGMRTYNFYRCKTCEHIFLGTPNFWRNFSRKYWYDVELRTRVIAGIMNVLTEQGRAVKTYINEHPAWRLIPILER